MEARGLEHARVIDVGGLGALIRALRERGHTVIGPSVRDGAIVLQPVDDIDDLPAGWGEHQDAGSYRLRARDDGALFGFTTPATSWKPFLHPPRSLLFRARREAGRLAFVTEEEVAPRYAFLGVRSCDLAGIGVQDRVLASGRFPDPDYAGRRDRAFIVVAQCVEAGATCFCTSMGTGPTAGAGFDLALTELLSPEHRFVVQVGTDEGAAMVAAVPSRPASEEDLDQATGGWERAADQRKRLPAADVAALLERNLEHPRWGEVAERCLACTNCTMVCPTCFCGTVEDTTDLSGAEAERWRRWDSCFTLDFSHLVGGEVRTSVRSRYRQWLTHKLSTWHDQFGESGCVGCGRCITWCPVGIDLTEEVAGIAATDSEERA